MSAHAERDEWLMAQAALGQHAPLEVLVRRHAYLSVLTEEKLRWAAGLLERELQDRPGQLATWPNTGYFVVTWKKQ